MKVKISLLFLIILASSCTRLHIRNNLEQFYSSEIQIPTSLIAIRNGVISPHLSDESKPLVTLVIYYSSQGCTACKVSHIADLDTLYQLKIDSSLFMPTIIISPTIEQYADIASQLKYQKHLYPVYIDRQNDFQRLNRSLPTDTRFHTFLLDENNRIALVGNPLANNSMWVFFKSTLDNILAHNGVYVPEK